MKNKKNLLQESKPPAEFTRVLAAEIVKNLTSIGRFTSCPVYPPAEVVPAVGYPLGEVSDNRFRSNV